MLAYNLLQIKYIICYARHFGMQPDVAAKKWASNGLAFKFSQLYRNKFFDEEAKRED